MRFDHRRLAPLLGATVVAGALAAGCGTGDGAATPDAPERDARAESPQLVAKKLMRTLGTAKTNADCEGVRDLITRSPQKFFCPPVAGGSRIRDFQVVAAETYGTAAVIEYTTRRTPDGASMVMFQDPDANWAVSRFGLLTGRGVGTSDDESRAGFEAAVAKLLAAIRDRSCDGLTSIVVADFSSKRAFCKRTFARLDWIADGLEAATAARPRYLGGNGVFGFFGLQLDEPVGRYATIEVVKTAEGALEPFAILDIQRGPRRSG